MEISIKTIVFSFLGGLGLFLFGLRFMSDALQAVAGDRMRTILEHGTKNAFRGVLTGSLVTALIQSSSATTVLTVGLVNAGLLTLRQSIGVIMGANIGTTLTAFLIGFNLQSYALPILAIGTLLFLFAKKKKAQTIGQVLFGFGTLFFGLSIMGGGMGPLKDLPVFAELMIKIEDNAILGVIIGLLFTLIVQSSSATIGVMQELAFQGAISYTQAVPILFGDNIGTTITALLASIGANVTARRTALTHFLFNLVGTLIFIPMLALGWFEKFVIFVTNHIYVLFSQYALWENLNIKLQIAQTHAVFNITNTLIHLPLVGVLAYIVTKAIPEKPAPAQTKPTFAKYIDKRFLSNPAVALSQAHRESVYMFQLALKSYEKSTDYFYTYDVASQKAVLQHEHMIDSLEREITDYLVLASQKSLSPEDSHASYLIMRSLSDIERIGDHCENIMHQGSYSRRHKVIFSGEAQEELAKMVALTKETLELSITALSDADMDAAQQVTINEDMIDKMQSDYRKSHIRRLNAGICNGNNGAVFLELLGNLERISDHCRNIAGYVLGEE